jgi:amino acid adenylation domain-containing protein/non-ribosomal peptide synthase protein (TIGR01720 family)
VSRKNIENVYSLSPLQEGLLFHALYSSQRSVYAVQIAWTLEGKLDVAALERALGELLERHAILRTCFVWERLDKPMQVVRKRVELPLERQDLRPFPPAEQAISMARFAESERQRGFDLGRAPLIRFGLQQLGEERHRLLWTMHHLITDGWSLPLLVKEIFTLYEAHVRGEPVTLDRPRPYGEYIAWLKKQDKARTEAFWKTELQGFSAPTPFRVDRPASGGTGDGLFDERRLVLPEPLAKALAAFARQHRLTPSTVVQGAWALLLSRYSGEEDVLFGATVSGRSAPLAGIDRMVGVFINTLPVRVAVPPAQPILDWLTQLQKQQAELREHEHSPLVEVQGLSEIPRGTPLFESQVAFENYPEAEALVSAKGSLSLAEPAMRSQTHYPITLACSLRRELVIHLSYDARRFDAATIVRMLGHYRSLLEAIVGSKHRTLGELPLVTGEERHQLIETWNETAAPFPEEATIATLFEAQAARTPASPALVCGAEMLSFQTLDEQANRLAHRLRRAGVGPDVRVGLLLGRSAGAVIALLAILKAGGAYVPLDPGHPSKRLAQLLDEANITVVVSEQALLSRLPERALHVVSVDGEAASLAAESSGRPEGGAGPSNLVYVLFTSGSTGTPKGVAVEHRQLVNYVHGVSQRLALSPGASYGHISTLSADLGNTVLFPPLCQGGCLHLLPEALTTDPDALAAYASSHPLDCLKIVPSHLAALLSGAHPEQVLPRRVLVLGGEASSWELIARVEGLSPTLRILNHYGPTETTVGVLTEALRRGERVEGAATVPVGRPLPNSRIYVLDGQGQPVPVGVPGELYIGGAGVARGYLNRAEQTAERFVADPFSGVAGARMYRTGDKARYLADGRVVFLGRMDHQVKIRGYRVELGEIESALSSHAGVREAVVVVREESSGDARLVAYVVASEAPGPGADELSRHLEERLPAYMLPSTIVALTALPLTPNGKIDRQALALLDGPAEPASAEAVAPRSPVEEVLASIWADVFGKERIGVHDGFSELGGHSLIAIQIIARVREAFQAQVPLRAIFDAPTIALLAQRVEAAMREEEGLVVPPMERVPRDRPLRLSFAQERLWFLDQLEPDSALYNVPFAIRLGGQLDEPALGRALAELVRRHEVLRTTFASVEGRPVQVIHPERLLDLPLTDLGALPAETQEERIRSESRAEASRPFRLAEGPLLRARLLRLSPDEHVLLVTMHHIVSDGWTRGILNREVGLLYGAFRAGAPSPLPELALQYADYAEWQRRWLDGEVLERQLAYWKRELEGAPLVLALPTDYPRPRVRTHRGAQRSVVFSAELSKALKDLARREGATLYMTLLAALDVLLYRSTGQGDFLVGTSITNRTRAETEKLIGFFINALVLRARLTPELSFIELLARVRETCLGAYAHQDMPFERLVQELAPEPDPSRTPVFQVIFTMHNAPPEAMKLPGLTLRRMGTEIESSKYDLTFVMGEGPSAVGCSIAYNADLFEPSTIERMLAHLVTLLEGIVASPEKPISALPLLSRDERHRLLHTWNETAAPFPEEATIATLFEAQAARTPASPALVCGAETLSFQTLDEQANRLAHRLRRAGVGPDVRVGLLLGRSAQAIIALLAILKAGGAYVPLDAGHPSKRLAQLLDEANITVVVSEQALLSRLPERALSVISIDGEAALLAAESSARPEGGAGPSNLVYVLFTSGSTGTPKGVAVEHRQLVNYVYGVSQRLALSPGASYGHISTLSADLGNTVLFPPLCQGGCLHLLPEALTTDPDALAAYASSHPLDCLKIVPSHLGALLSGAHPEQVLPRKVLVLGGEASSWELIARVEGLSPTLRILNHYGPTETTVGVLTEALRRGERVAGAATVPVGRPLPNSRIYVLDGQGQPVPVGVPGELYIGGAGVARGYLNRAEQTAERFVADPFSGVAGARMYRTGDKARYLADGRVVFLGRMDHQVKIRGYRVELGEIESALSSHPGVREAVVVVREEASGDARLVAYVVASEAPGPGADKLSRHLEERLPAYMLPSTIVALTTLPLTPNGKIDRQALAQRETTLAQPSLEPSLPRTPVEEVLAGIWAEVFGRESAGIHESFAEAGGHSLLAIQIVARARDAFQVPLPLRSLFESPTIAGLAQQIEILLRAGGAAALPPVEAVPRDAPLRLSFAQERFWFLAQLEPESAAYNVPLALRLGGALDPLVLERALSEIVRRHEVLRTTFTAEGEAPSQIVQAAAEISVPLSDLSTLPAPEREAGAKAAVASEARLPFDLRRGPVFRARLFRLSVDDHVLVLTLHHIVSDALARAILVRELCALYRAFHAGQPSPLSPLPIQYADHAEWQRRWLEGGALAQQLAYWKAQLAGVPRTLDLPLDHPRPALETHRGARLSFRLPRELGAALGALARREGATLFMTLLAAFDILLSRHTGQDDLLVGTPAANRGRESEGLIGLFLNTLVLRATLGPELTFLELLARVRETCLGAYAHQDLPVERLVMELSPERDLGRSPLFQVMFTYQSSSPEIPSLPGLSVQGASIEGESAKFDLSLGMGQGPEGLAGTFEYNADLFEPSSIECMAQRLSTLLEGIVAAPERRLAELPLLPPWERERLLVRWNETSADYPRESSAFHLFAEQVERSPDSIALVYEGQTLSYRALAARSRGLAAELQRRGIGPGSLVGLALDRSLDLVVAVLAIWCSGAAYVPLDPAYPRERLAFMMDDAGLSLLVTQQALIAALPGSPLPRLFIDDDARWDAVERASSSPAAGPEDLAYVIYTSGSTGAPKGVAISHRALVNFLWSMKDRPGITPADRLLAVTSLSFDIAGLELFLPLMVGARVEIAGAVIAADGAALARRLESAGITLMQATPSTYRLLLEAGWRGNPDLRLLVGGEAVPRELANRLLARAGAVWNMYGPTETTIWSCIEPLSPGEGPVSIGRPIANTRVLVVDAQLELAPIGVPGELVIGGDGLARGYLARPELSEARFVADPFHAGQRLYRTGDLCRFLPDGRLEFLGRIDQQVKIRGHRIELGEIESVLGAHPAVSEVVVAAPAEASGERRLVAYLVLTGDSIPGPGELRSFLGAKLPEIMIPSAYVMLDALPLTANGKVDRRALPAPEPSSGGSPIVAPRGPIEEALATLFAELLHLDPSLVGAHEGFFTLGGHSLLGARLVARIRAAFGVDLPLRALFESSSPAALAERVEQALRAGEGVSAPPLSPVSRGGALPLSFGEERLWFLDTLTPGSTAYVLPLAVRLTGPLDAAALEQALQDIVERHELLRTAFALSGDSPVRVIHPHPTMVLDRLSRPAIEASEREALIRREASAQVTRAFDLQRGPLLRATLLALGDDDHALVLTMHHIVSDAWSIGIFLAELSEFYAAASAGRRASLPVLPIQYADHAAWQRAWLQGEVLDRQLAYWRGKLDGAQPALDLPVDHAPAGASAHRGGRSTFTLPPSLSAALSELSRREGATLFMTLLAAVFTLLHRHSGQEDILVGAPVANRSRPETEGLIGFFVNTLVLRVQLGFELSFTDLLRQVKETCLGAYAHQDLPFERLVRELAPDRQGSRAPLVQVVFALQNMPREALALPGLTIRPLAVEGGPAKFDLSLTMSEGAAGLTGAMVFDAERFEASTIERLLGHFRVLLESIVADPAAPLGALSMLERAEREALLALGEATQVPLPEGASISALVEAQAARTPEAVAVAAGGRALCYRDLDGDANRLARLLHRRGAGKGARVGVCLERSIETVIGLLGVLKAGAAYVALDPALPVERLAFALQDSGATMLLTQQKLAPRLAGLTLPVLQIDADRAAIDEESDAALASSPAPPDPAYVIYTSGSTGRPKGVELLHRGVINLSCWHQKTYGLCPGDRTTHLAAPGFDASVWEIWPTLIAGATLVIPDEQTRAAPRALAAWLVAEGITISFLPTPLAEAVLADPWPAGGMLRFLLTGGDRLRRRPPPGLPFRLVNHYGPTEATVVATFTEIAAEGDDPPPIGKAIDNLCAHVLDARLEPVPLGVPGELALGGVGLARGYLNQPELTASRFVQSPFGAPGERLYRTGDRVRRRLDGDIEFLGRIDEQVKIRGNRVELGEIESVLARQPSVKEAVVLLREDVAGEPRLCAYVVPREAGYSPAALREALRALLPEYMVPAAFVALPALPLTANGKIDRRALPIPDLVAKEDELASWASGPVEEALGAIFAEVLGLAPSRVGPGSDFFALGGHSLLATQALSRIQRAFDIDFPLLALFEGPTPRALAVRVEEALRGGAGSATPPLQRAPRGGPLPLSFAQERLWFLDQLAPGDISYVIPLGLRLEGPLAIEHLQRALEEIVRRHEALRTTFTLAEGKPVQLIHPPRPLGLSLTRWPSRSVQEREELARQGAIDEARAPFDLATGPLFRARLFQIAEGDHLLLLTFHHIVADGWTVGVLGAELSALYGAFSRGEPSPLPELSIQAADHAVWQRRWLEGGALEAQLGYWKGKLAGAPGSIDLPTDRPRPSVETHRGDRVRLSLSPALSAELRALSRREGTTLFMTLLSAFFVLLQRLSGQDDLVVGSPIAGRTRAETERLIGFFVNTLVLRVELDGDPSFQALLARVKETCLGAYAHQELPFERLVQELSPERSLARSPLFQVMFTLQNGPREVMSLPGLRLRPARSEMASAKFDLTLSMSEGAEGLGGSLEYSSDLFDAPTIERMVARLQLLLEAVVAKPEAPLSALPFLLAGEEQALLGAWAGPAPAPASPLCLHQLFEAQAERSPSALAVIDGEQRLTYAQVEQRANRLAHALLARGVGPESLVGVCLSRSSALVIALLAVLKAGGAYVPLDPAYPAARLAQILDDAALRLIVCEVATLAALPVERGPVLVIDDAGALDGAGEVRPTSGVRPDQLAYVLFTSGSTGRPKGVAIEHRSPVALIDWAKTIYSLDDCRALLFSTSISFDLSVFELFLPLASGGAVVVADNALALPGLPARDEVTMVNTVPIALTELLRMKALPISARIICLAGEPLSPTLVEQTYACPGVSAVYNLYGPTEDTTYSTFTRVEPGAPVTIGRPITGGRARILDRHRHLVPAGVVGEIYLGGIGLARGYLGQPELTAERFVPDPFAAGERLYRTGDLGRFRADGEIEYLGRIDHQVKLRGFRIELGDIESALARHPRVREAVALVREDHPGERRLVAYLALDGGGGGEPPLGPTELRAFLRERLPEHMVPSTFVLVDRLPLTPNGKVDRRALPRPDESAAPSSSDELAAPGSAVEETLAAIWASVLRLPRVGIHDNFFEIGGDSILSIQIVVKAQQAGLELTPRQLFQHQTIAELAEVVGLRRAAPAEQGPVTGTAPLTPIQRWWLEQELASPHHWNQAFFFEASEALDGDLLDEAFTALLAQHDTLRLRLASPSMQLFAPLEGSSAGILRRVDLGACPPAERDQVLRAIAAEVQTSLDLDRGPVIRAAFFHGDQASPDRLLVAIHHLAVDAVSWRILLDDLWTAYQQRRRGEAVHLPPRTSSFKRWAEALEREAAGERIRGELDCWLAPRRREVPALPLDHQQGENTEESARSIFVSLDADETESLLREVPRAYRTQINDALLTAFAEALAGWLGSETVLFDLEGHGREDLFPELDITRTVGWFTTVFPVVLEVTAGADPSLALPSVKEQLRAIPNHGVGHGLLLHLRAADDEVRELRALPRADVAFNYLGQLDRGAADDAPLRRGKQDPGPTHSPRARRRYALEVTASVLGGRLQLRFTYSDSLHRAATIQALADAFLASLRALIAHCLAPGAGGYTPSDFEEEDLSQEDIRGMLAALDGEGSEPG